jgi:endonuclease YncB( thermonuclease family)
MIGVLAAITASAVAIGTAQAAQSVSYYAVIDHVLDADTVRVCFSDWPTPVKCMAVRELGVNAPESRKGIGGAKCDKEQRMGVIAKARVKLILSPGEKVRFTWAGSDDKYFRLLGSIEVLPDKDSPQLPTGPLGKILLKEGLAVPYDGGTKSSFCG